MTSPFRRCRLPFPLSFGRGSGSLRLSAAGAAFGPGCRAVEAAVSLLFHGVLPLSVPCVVHCSWHVMSCGVSSSSSGTGTPTPPVSAGVVTGAACDSTGAARVVVVEAVGIGATRLRYQCGVQGCSSNPKSRNNGRSRGNTIFKQMRTRRPKLDIETAAVHANTSTGMHHQAINVQAPSGFHRWNLHILCHCLLQPKEIEKHQSPFFADGHGWIGWSWCALGCARPCTTCRA